MTRSFAFIAPILRQHCIKPPHQFRNAQCRHSTTPSIPSNQHLIHDAAFHSAIASHGLLPVHQRTSEFIIKYNSTLLSANINSVRLGNLSKQRKQGLLLDAMRQCENKYIMTHEMEGLAMLNKCTVQDISMMMSQMRAYARLGYGKGGRITRRTQMIVRQWLEKNEWRVPDSEEHKQLLQETGWTPVQLNYQLYLMRDKYQSNDVEMVSNEEGDAIIRKWLEENDHKALTRDDRITLQGQTGWSRKKLGYHVRKLTSDAEATGSAQVTPETKAIVGTWLETHNYRMPTDTEREQLLHETGWSRMQLKNQLHRMKDLSGHLSAEARFKIMSWLHEHNYESPTIQERTELREATGLSRRQLNAFLRAQQSRETER